MASSLLNLTTILSLLFLASLSHTALSTHFDHNDNDENEESYTLDAPFASPKSLRSPFLLKIKKGTRCNPIHHNLCNGLSANNGTSLLYCCKEHCRNVLTDRHNCGKCLKKCAFGEICCGGVCTNVAYDNLHCGDCDNACLPGVRCEYGSCGYA